MVIKNLAGFCPTQAKINAGTDRVVLVEHPASSGIFFLFFLEEKKWETTKSSNDSESKFLSVTVGEAIIA
ncbi:MAG: hypothetical protein ABI784_02305 [Ginsengibacter sp.]